MQGGNELEGTVGIVAGLHIHADEAAQLCGFADQHLNVGQALVIRDIDTELGEFQRNIALNARVMDGGKGAYVNVTRFGGFFQAGDALAEMIEGNGNPFRIELAADCQRLV